MDSSVLINSMSPFVILRVPGVFVFFNNFTESWCIFYANSEDPNQTPHYAQRAFGAKMTSMRRHHVASTLIRSHFYVMCPLGVASDLGRLCLPVSVLWDIKH